MTMSWKIVLIGSISDSLNSVMLFVGDNVGDGEMACCTVLKYLDDGDDDDVDNCCLQLHM